MTITVDRNIYGTVETSGLVDGRSYHEQFRDAETVYWTDPRLARITRLRLLSDPGYPWWDVSYVHGVLRDGSPCIVEVGFDQLPKRGRARAIVEAAIADGVHAKRLGVFDAISTLN